MLLRAIGVHSYAQLLAMLCIFCTIVPSYVISVHISSFVWYEHFVNLVVRHKELDSVVISCKESSNLAVAAFCPCTRSGNSVSYVTQ